MRTILPEFVHLQPDTLEEALSVMAGNGPQDKVLAGGTDIVPKLASKEIQPGRLIDIGRIEQLAQIRVDEEALHIGSMVRIHTLESSGVIAEKAPILSAAAARMANLQVRNLGTIGGNLINASPAADLAPPLLALGAEVVLRSPNGQRVLPLCDFFLEPGKTAIGSGELLEEIRIPVKPGSSSFIKLGRRQAACLSIASVAVFLVHSNDQCREVRIGMGAVGPTPLRALEAEAFLKGKTLSESVIEQASEIAAGETAPISDLRASREYRIKMCQVLVRRCLEQALRG